MADHNLFTLKAFRQTAQSHVRWATGSRGSQFMCGTKGGGKPIGLADALPRERTLSGNVDTLEAHRCGLTLSGQRGRGFPPNSINLSATPGRPPSASRRPPMPGHPELPGTSSDSGASTVPAVRPPRATTPPSPSLTPARWQPQTFRYPHHIYRRTVSV
jgi:hypothetical protein